MLLQFKKGMQEDGSIFRSVGKLAGALKAPVLPKRSVHGTSLLASMHESCVLSAIPFVEDRTHVTCLGTSGNSSNSLGQHLQT